MRHNRLQPLRPGQRFNAPSIELLPLPTTRPTDLLRRSLTVVTFIEPSADPAAKSFFVVQMVGAEEFARHGPFSLAEARAAKTEPAQLVSDLQSEAEQAVHRALDRVRERFEESAGIFGSRT